MATRATQDHVRPEGPESGRLGQEAGRPAPVEPLRAITRPVMQPRPLSRGRTAPITDARGDAKTAGLFRKMLIRDLTLWPVLTAGPSAEVVRTHLQPGHSLFGAADAPSV